MTTNQQTDKTDKPKKKAKPTRTTAKGPRQGTIAEQVVKLKLKHPTLSERDIAAQVGCAKTNVHETLERYGIRPEKIDGYKNNRADIFAGLQDRIFNHLSDAALEKTPAIQLVTAASILYDKERLERGQSTDNQQLIVTHIKDLQARRNALDINDD